ncbi:TPA: hypothetical protein N0F65_004521, partial [Lagenidium giganteum]
EYTVEYVDDQPETLKYLKREGQVKITYANGDTYEGAINADRHKQGEGKYIWRKKVEDDEVKEVAWYEGMYVLGERHGIGKMVFPNGDTYHGEWRRNKMNGDGSYMYANGDIFSGKFENGIRVGKGTYEFAEDKSLLVGNWSDHAIQDGKWMFKDGGSYVGRFENGKPIGNCLFKFPSGLQQDGEYIKTPEVNAAGEEVTAHKFVGGTVVKVR